MSKQGLNLLLQKKIRFLQESVFPKVQFFSQTGLQKELYSLKFEAVTLGTERVPDTLETGEGRVTPGWNLTRWVRKWTGPQTGVPSAPSGSREGSRGLGFPVNSLLLKLV